MKINELRVWRFQCFGPTDAAIDSDGVPTFHSVPLDPGVTAMIGRNGSGKSALLAALVRVFGETREERTVQAEDFFVPPGETLDSAPLRRFFIEAEFGFPELDTGQKDAEKTVPAAFRNMVIEGPGGKLIARVRLEAIWQSTGSLDGDIEETAYWLLTTDAVPFGEVPDPTIKRKMSPALPS
jgi:putative ATP-dependent endonuclease of OLD family